MPADVCAFTPFTVSDGSCDSPWNSTVYISRAFYASEFATRWQSAKTNTNECAEMWNCGSFAVVAGPNARRARARINCCTLTNANYVEKTPKHSSSESEYYDRRLEHVVGCVVWHVISTPTYRLTSKKRFRLVVVVFVVNNAAEKRRYRPQPAHQIQSVQAESVFSRDLR